MGGYCIFAIIKFGGKTKQYACKNIIIDIDDEYDFINEEDIIQTLKEKKIYPINSFIDHKKTNIIENALSQMSLSKEVECYYCDSNLYIDLYQRKPIYRIYSKNETYYVDNDRSIMPTSKNFTAQVPVVLGHIDKVMACEEIYDLVNFILEDEHWKYLFKQIYITEKKEIVLISQQGIKEIHLGNITEYKEKFEVLRKWYEQYPERNCDTLYTKVNLKYDNLIYCTRKK